MSGNGATLKSTRYPRPFTPHNVPAVLRWLRLNQTTGTYATVSDQKGGSDATQGASGNRPSGTTLGGLPAANFDGTDDWLAEPIVAGKNDGATTRGFWFRFQPATVSGLHTLIGGESIAGASANSFWVTQNGTSLLVDVYHSTFVARRFTVANAFSSGASRSYSWEEDLGQATEATKCTVWIDGVKQAGTFSDTAGTPGAQPSALVVPTGAWAIGIENISTNLRPLSGILGRNLLELGGAGGISGGGLFSPADRALIEAFE